MNNTWLTTPVKQTITTVRFAEHQTPIQFARSKILNEDRDLLERYREPTFCSYNMMEHNVVEEEYVPYSNMLDEKVENIQQCLRGLEALKKNIEFSKEQTENDTSMEPDTKLDRVRFYADEIMKLEMGILEAKMNMDLYHHIRSLEEERHKSGALIKRLRDENSWVREELSACQQKLKKAEEENIDLKSDLEHFKYMNSLKQFDDPTGNDYDSGRGTDIFDTTRPFFHNKTLQDLGFDPDEDEPTSNHLSAQSPTNSMTTRSSQNDLMTESRANYATSSYDDMPFQLKKVQNVVNLLCSQGKYDGAMQSCNLSLEKFKKESGEESSDVACIYVMFATIFREQKNYKNAIAFIRMALEIREKVYGQDHLLVASTQSTLSMLYAKNGDPRSIPHAQKAVEIREKLLGPENAEVAKGLATVGTAQMNAKKYADALATFKKMLTIYENTLGTDDPASFKAKQSVCTALIKLGNVKEAESIYIDIIRQAHKKCFNRRNASYPSILDVAEDREKNKRTDPSVDDVHVHRCVETLKDTPAALSAVKQMAQIFRKQKKFDAASLLEDVVIRANREPKGTFAMTAMEASQSSSNGT